MSQGAFLRTLVRVNTPCHSQLRFSQLSVDAFGFGTMWYGTNRPRQIVQQEWSVTWSVETTGSLPTL